MKDCEECDYFILRDGYDYCRYWNQRVTDSNVCSFDSKPRQSCVNCVYFLNGECLRNEDISISKSCESYVNDNMTICADCIHKKVCVKLHWNITNCKEYNGR